MKKFEAKEERTRTMSLRFFVPHNPGFHNAHNNQSNEPHREQRVIPVSGVWTRRITEVHRRTSDGSSPSAEREHPWHCTWHTFRSCYLHRHELDRDQRWIGRRSSFGLAKPVFHRLFRQL